MRNLITVIFFGIVFGMFSAGYSTEKKLTASEAQTNDNFGRSISISGDYAIVGANNEDGGAAYIYHRNQGGKNNWGEIKKLTASDAQANDYFGRSVSINGNYAIVGANNEDAGGSEAGAAYIFYRNQGGKNNWGEVTKLTASDSQANDRFGYSVSIRGKYAFVGAIWEDGGLSDLKSNAGAVYVFYRNQGGKNNWGEIKKLTASDAQGGEHFGISVSISGRYAIVGANKEDANGIEAGAAYIFHRNQGGKNNWGEIKKLSASDTQAYDHFGISVSISGKYAVVGAWVEDGGSGDPKSNAGAAYIFHCNQGGKNNWGEIKKLTASDAQTNDVLGNSVSISGNYVVVGAKWEDSGIGDPKHNAGAAYIYHRNQGGKNNWGEIKKLTASDAQANDYFGASVSISGKYAIIGANSEDGGAGDPKSNAGAAYIFDCNNGSSSWKKTSKTTSKQNITSDVPNDFSLLPAYPNPFKQYTVITFTLPKVLVIKLSIYNLRGQLIRTLVADQKNAGSHKITWDGKNAAGITVPSGVYCVIFKANSFVANNKIIYVK